MIAGSAAKRSPISSTKRPKVQPSTGSGTDFIERFGIASSYRSRDDLLPLSSRGAQCATWRSRGARKPQNPSMLSFPARPLKLHVSQGPSFEHLAAEDRARDLVLLNLARPFADAKCARVAVHHLDR